jgi:hypothetical protein
MQEELRRSNTIGDSKGILYFASTVLKNGEIKRDSARQICSFINDVRINFNSAVAFFEYLGFINASANLLTPTEDGKKLYSLLGDGGFEEALCEACLNKVTTDEIIDINALCFDVVKGKYYIKRHGFPIAAAVFRNVLIQLNALSELRDGSGSLELSERYEGIFAKVQKKAQRRLSLDALKKQLEQQENQGEAAEKYVVEYEKARLVSTVLAKKVKRISDIDVSAGYDVVSFETDTSIEYDRFIEVKSFVGQPHFYWSKNEIEVATIYGDKYYLYLINAGKITEYEYVPTIIRNPVKTVIESDGWLMQPTSYLVLPAGAD